MARRTCGRMLLLATHFAIVHTAAWRDIWNPVIEVSKPEADGTVYVTLVSPHEHAHKHLLCMSSGVLCAGRVELQNRTDIVRYKVTNLTENSTYTIKIKPFDEHNLELDTWVVFPQTVFIPKGATPAPTTVTTPPATLHVIPAPVDNSHIILVQVGVPLLIVLCVGVTAIYCLLRTGYWRKIRLLRCCGLPKLLGWDPPDILQLYVTESPQFSHFILTHGTFLKKVLGVRSVDCQQARSSSDPERYMKSLTSTHHVLIYTSPILMSHIRVMQGEGSAEDLQDTLLQESQAKTHIQVCLEIIELLCKSREQRTRCLGRVGVVFVISGCSDTDVEDEILLRRYFETVPHFTVIEQGSLAAPHSLVSYLSGGRSNAYGNLHICDWAGSIEAAVLRAAADQLKRNNAQIIGMNNPPSDAECGSSESDVGVDSDDTDENCEPEQSAGNAHITLNVDVHGQDMDVTRTTVDHSDVDVTDRGCQDRPSFTVKLNLISTMADHGQNVDTPINEVTSGTISGRNNELGGHMKRGVRTQTTRQDDIDARTRAHARTVTGASIRAHAQTDTDAMFFACQSAVAMGTPKLAANTAPVSQLNGFHRKTETGAVCVHNQGQNIHYTRSANAATRKTSAPKDSGFSSSVTDGHGKSSVSGFSSLPVYSPGCQYHGRHEDEQSCHQIDDGMRNPPRWNKAHELLRGRNSACHEQRMAHGFPEENGRTQAPHAMSDEQRPLLGYGNRQHESSPVHGHNNLRHEHGSTQAPSIVCHRQSVAMGYRMHQEEIPQQGSSGTYHESRPQQTPQNVYDEQRPQQNSNSMYDEHRLPESCNNMHHNDSLEQSSDTMHHEHRPQQSRSNVLSVQATVHISSSMLELHPGGLCVEQPYWRDASQRLSLLHDDADFHPPESIGSQVSIHEQSRLLNENTEQHWSSNTG